MLNPFEVFFVLFILGVLVGATKIHFLWFRLVFLLGGRRRRKIPAKPEFIPAVLLRLSVALGLAFAAAGCFGTGPEAGVDRMPLARAIINGETVPVRVAETPRHRALGFQYVDRSTLSEERLLLRWDEPGRPSLHMRNVPGPLVAAWIDASGEVVELQHMEPGSSGYKPERPVVAVLEVSPEEARRLGLEPGVSVRVSSQVREPQQSVR